MNYIVFDLEWNQCPDGKEFEEPDLPFEIIEIGAIKLNSEFEIVDTYHEIIRPIVYQTLHFMTKEVVRLTEDDWEDCRTFPDISREFFEWCGEDPLWCTWGPGDLMEFQRNLSWHELPSPFAYPLVYYDLQKIFSIVFEDRKTRRSLETAAEFCSLPPCKAFHNAWADARYTAEILKRLTPEQVLNNSSIDYYRTPASRREEIYMDYPTYTKFVSKPFRDKTLAMKDRVVTSTKCYKCQRTLRKKIRWFSSGSRNYLCLCRCEEHGWMKGKIRMRQNKNGLFYVVKTLKLVSEEDALAIKEKQELLRIKRRLKRNSLT